MKFLFIFFSFGLFAGEAMITVLEAPLFQNESMESKIIQYERKGTVIYIDERDLKSEVEDSFSQTIPYKDGTISVPPATKKIFYRTLDKNGKDAFILGEHIKVIYKDFREFTDKLPDQDPTDYRITEPLQKDYPFMKINQPMVNLFFGIGPQPKINYPYSENIIYEEYQFRTGWGVNFFWPKNLGQSFRWGINGAFYNGNRRFMLQNETKSYEQQGSLSLGPELLFDALDGAHFQIQYAAGLNVNYTRTLVTQDLTNGTTGERAFQGIGLVPQGSIYMSLVNLLGSVDMVFIIEAQLALPQKLTPSDPNPDNGSWNSTTDYIETPFGGVATFFLGFASKI